MNSGRWLSRAIRAQRRCRPGLRYLCQQCIRQRPFVPATVARADDRLAALSVNSPAGDERQQPLQSCHSASRPNGCDWSETKVAAAACVAAGTPTSHWFEPEHSEQLVRASLAVLTYAVEADPAVRELFQADPRRFLKSVEVLTGSMAITGRDSATLPLKANLPSSLASARPHQQMASTGNSSAKE